MGKIRVLDSITIDKIAAGEVVERPISVVKELVENAIDAGATMITVDVKDGGISSIRVTDNGCGIDTEDVQTAFLRHATSKILSVDDLTRIQTLGFRGEALSSIAAVCQVELITKTPYSLSGIRMTCDGGIIGTLEEVGAPNGTTIIARNIFFNVPVRRNFLRASITEASYITDLMQHIAMSKPNIAFKFISNGQTKFFTSGNGELSEIIYRIYGKEVSDQCVYCKEETEGIIIEGYIGKPIINRANRSYETFFVNERYVKSVIISDAVEEGYKEYLMQHKYPFVVLNFTIDPEKVDVNVHPTKMDIRINDPEYFVQFVMDMVKKTMKKQNLISEIIEPVHSISAKEIAAKQKTLTKEIPEPFETGRRSMVVTDVSDHYYSANQETVPNAVPVASGSLTSQEARTEYSDIILNRILGTEVAPQSSLNTSSNVIKQRDQVIIEKHDQLELFADVHILSKEAEDEYVILGQLFDTYWILSFHDKMYIVDQHAAHEKVKYEQLLQHLKDNRVTTQLINPPIIVTLSDCEFHVFDLYKSSFQNLGFELEPFGGNEYAIRSIPTDLYGSDPKDLFMTTLDELVEFPLKVDPSLIMDKLASMACKAAVKGNHKMTLAEAKELMRALLQLENPYQCPHGRPTIISMSKYEIEKKFKRVL